MAIIMADHGQMDGHRLALSHNEKIENNLMDGQEKVWIDIEASWLNLLAVKLVC